MTYLTAPDATRKAVKGVTLAPVEDLTPLIQAALAGTLGDDTVIAHTRSQVNAKYQPGVDKVGAGLAALRRANPGADLRSVDHAALYQQLVDGSLQDENGLAIKLANRDELNGAKKVTDTCLKITASDPQGGVMTYLTAPDATRKAVAGLKNPFRTRKISSSFDGSAIQPPPGEATELSYDGVLAAQLHDDLNPGFDVYGQPDPFRLAGPSTLPQASATMPTFNPDNDYRLPLPGVSSAPNPWGLEFSGHAGSGMGPGTAGDREPVAASDFESFMIQPPGPGSVSAAWDVTSTASGPPSSLLSATSTTSLGERPAEGEWDRRVRQRTDRDTDPELGPYDNASGQGVIADYLSAFEAVKGLYGHPNTTREDLANSLSYTKLHTLLGNPDNGPIIAAIDAQLSGYQTLQPFWEQSKRNYGWGSTQEASRPPAQPPPPMPPYAPFPTQGLYAPPPGPPPGWPVREASVPSGISQGIYAPPGSLVSGAGQANPQFQEVPEIPGRLYHHAGDRSQTDPSVNNHRFIPDGSTEGPEELQPGDAHRLSSAYQGPYQQPGQGRGASNQGHQGWLR